MSITGSCECGAVVFELSGRLRESTRASYPLRFWLRGALGIRPLPRSGP